MKKIIIIIIIAGVGVGAYYFVFNKVPTNTSNVPAAQSETAPMVLSSDVKVSIKNFLFNQSTFTITKGVKVTWTNNDVSPHTVTTTVGAGPSSGSLSQGEAYSYVFDAVGTFKYVCSFHPGMQGTVVVTE